MTSVQELPVSNAETSVDRGNLLLAAIIVAAIARLIFLAADPSVLKHTNDIGDEGYWSFEARNLVLYHRFVIDEYSQAAVAPLYAAFAYVVYLVGGVSLYSTRVPSASFAILSIALLYALLRKYGERFARISALTLAVENSYFIGSRIGHVETTSGFFLLLAFYCVLARERPFLGGMAFGLGVAAKFANVLMGPAFLVFFAIRFLRKDAPKTEIVLFGLGGAAIAAAIAAYVGHFYPLFAASYAAQAAGRHGLLIVQHPPRVLIDFVTNTFFSYPSIALLLIMLGLYLRRLNLDAVFVDARASLHRLDSLDVMLVSWFVGYGTTLLLFSDLVPRRFALLTIPLAIVPAKLWRDRAVVVVARSSVGRRWMTWIPWVVAGALVGNKLLRPLAPYPYSFYLSVVLSVLGVSTLGLIESRNRHVAWFRTLSPVVWIVLASTSFAAALITRIVPAFGGHPSLLLTIVMAGCWVAALALFASVAQMNVTAAIVTLVWVCVGLDLFELSRPSFSVRDASRRIGEVAGDDDYVIGDLGHELSLEGRFHPLQWYPQFYNTRFAAQVKPKYLIRGDDRVNLDQPRAADEDPTQDPEPRNTDLEGIGVQTMTPILSFGLYPVAGVPRSTYTLYRLQYQR